ncbi:glutathione hydrolase 7 isoform X3 [Motacilla alba alba]|uniref:glutathione hydrolase 7 isoform X3 n=1 Tax=Motacilla alba alba TaxID=1094192 RepID=UPI0018D4F6DB|nr:glutathione hydrolase 7 isoform X3 [Motacilla alba alba]
MSMPIPWKTLPAFWRRTEESRIQLPGGLAWNPPDAVRPGLIPPCEGQGRRGARAMEQPRLEQGSARPPPAPPQPRTTPPAGAGCRGSTRDKPGLPERPGAPPAPGRSRPSARPLPAAPPGRRGAAPFDRERWARPGSARLWVPARRDPAMAVPEAVPGRQRALAAGSPVDYMSITSFPRLPEEEPSGAAESGLRARKEEDAFLGEQDTDPDSFLKSARLQRLPSSSSEMGSQDVSPLQETSKDPFSGDCSCQQDGLTVIITACLTFATGVTVALIMQIYFGDPQLFHRGAVVTDAARCTVLGTHVLARHGSSVDAAIASALCAGIVNPHTSGLGGGGVMLIHDIRKNRSWVIDFREVAPLGIPLEGDLQQDTKPGLLVGVPGMILGMHQAHQLHGRLPWSELLGLTAGVAQNGFNVTHDLAKALSELKDLNYSERFQKIFLPDGQPLLPGMFIRRLDLAAVLQLLGAEGVSAFYSGNLTQEMISEVSQDCPWHLPAWDCHLLKVHNYGGVLVEEDFSNYSVTVEDPMHTIYRGHLVFTPPPPHAGPALISALNILEGFNITRQGSRGNILHWMVETLKIALSLASNLGDPSGDMSVTHTAESMVSKSEASSLRQLINDSQSFLSMPHSPLESGAAASQVLVMGPDDFIVAVVSSLNRPFGSGIVTPSGILLNSQMLDFSWQNKTMNHSIPRLQNLLQPGKRPRSFLLPTIVRPSEGMCGTYLCLGANHGDRALSSIVQVLVNVLTFNKNLSESLSLGRLHPQLQSNTLQVDSEFPEEDIEFLVARGHQVDKVPVVSLVHGARRTNSFIIGLKDPRSADAAGATIL